MKLNKNFYIDITKRDSARSCGCYGEYFLVRALGKELGVKTPYAGSGYKTMKLCRESVWWKTAEKELALMHRAYRSGFTPKPYGIVPVKNSEGYVPGILMQHLRGKTLSTWLNCEPKTGEKLMRIHEERGYEYIGTWLQAELLKYGVDWSDNHEGNIIANISPKGRVKLYAIDFSPSNTKHDGILTKKK